MDLSQAGDVIHPDPTEKGIRAVCPVYRALSPHTTQNLPRGEIYRVGVSCAP